MTQSVADPSLYLQFKDDKLIGINGTYVDDLLRCGTPELEDLCKLTYERFETIGTEDLPLTFAGFNIQPRPDDAFSIDQLFYHEKLEIPEAMAS